MSAASLPLPPLDDINRAWFSSLRAGELRIQKCEGCGRLRHTPRPMCPWCNEIAHRWEQMSGRGRIWSFVVAHPPVLPVFAARVPMPVAIVEIEEDPRIRIVGELVENIDPEMIVIGAAVEAVFEPVTDEMGLIRWNLI
jgi:uncharacterized OB-fold protein